MLHGFAFLLFAAELIWLASGLPTAGAVVFGYAAVSFVLVGIAYLFGRPGFLGKRIDGRFALPFRLLHAPFHVVSGLSAWLRRIRQTEPWHPIVEGLWLGERTDDVPPETERIVDLTVEHDRIGPDGVDYVLVATLDGQAPDRAAVARAIERMIADPRPTYVHCFAGRGRSATFVAAYLLTTGVVQTAAEAESYMQERRPVVRLGDEQMELAQTFERAA